MAVINAQQFSNQIFLSIYLAHKTVNAKGIYADAILVPIPWLFTWVIPAANFKDVDIISLLLMTNKNIVMMLIGIDNLTNTLKLMYFNGIKTINGMK